MSMMFRVGFFVHMQVQTITSPKAGILQVTTPVVICTFYHMHQARRPLTGGSPVYEYPLLGQWIMMDMDDGYILWTGIWKGLYRWLERTTQRSLRYYIRFLALGHSKGNLNGTSDRFADLVYPLSRHRENGGIRARTSRAHPQGSWGLFEDPRDLDAV